MVTRFNGNSFGVNAKVREDCYALKPRRVEDIRSGESPCTEDYLAANALKAAGRWKLMATRSWELICDEAIMR